MLGLVNYYVPPKNRLHKSTINQVEKPVVTTNWTGIIICDSWHGPSKKALFSIGKSFRKKLSAGVHAVFWGSLHRFPFRPSVYIYIVAEKLYQLMATWFCKDFKIWSTGRWYTSPAIHHPQGPQEGLTFQTSLKPPIGVLPAKSGNCYDPGRPPATHTANFDRRYNQMKLESHWGWWFWHWAAELPI